MNHARHDLLTISTFGRAAQLSRKALRLYAQLGLLEPSYIDPQSGYRYYHRDQLRAARLMRKRAIRHHWPDMMLSMIGFISRGTK